ncbi:MAG: alpha/beta fold hydrolase [Solirubrobacteraceae bacterium]
MFVAMGAWACAWTATAQAQIAWAPCGNSNEYACGHLTVPLQPGGSAPGTITLAMRRHRAPVGEAHEAIVALAGGPGQAALPFAEDFARLFGPIAATRDLIVFDQRGIGLSHPLSCHRFELNAGGPAGEPAGRQISECAAQLGPERSDYTTADTVADIEAIRQAGGYEKLVLYGTSYGTKVAEQYAQDYPSHVEALVLDSVVPPNGPDTLSRPTFAAMPRILRQVCVEEACAHITSDPVADLARVVKRMSHAPLRGRVIDADGNAHEVSITADALFEILLSGDFSQVLRAEFVTALAAAARGDAAPLGRLLATADSAEGEQEDFDTPLYYATTCEEETFPWSRTGDANARIAQATAAARALPASAFAPFTETTALEEGDIQACAHWPFSSPAPPLDEAPFPNVPTLILSGADDLRTPTANAREVAAQIPDAHLLVVPYTGHSVLTDEPTPCAREALKAMFSSGSIKPCAATPPPPALRPPPLPPLLLRLIAPTRGYRGLPGRTLHAVTLTLADLLRQLALQLEAVASPENLATLRTGGLRAGWAEYAGGTLSFHGYSYVPGVTISGTIKSEAANVQVAGSAAAHGTLRLGPQRSLVGTLAGSHVVLTASSSATAAIVGVDAETSSHSGSGGSATRAAARRLAGLLRRVQP